MKRTLPAVAAALLLTAAGAQAQTWNVQIVDDVQNTGFQSRIVMMGDGTPYIVYQAYTGVLTLAKWVDSGEGGGWDKISSGRQVRYTLRHAACVGPGDSLHVVASLDAPSGIAYNIWRHSTQSWEMSWQPITTEIGDLSMAVIDSAGVVIPAIVYSAYFSPYRVAFARRDPGTGDWNIQTVYDDSRNEKPWLAIDSQYKAHVSFHEPQGDDLLYATNSGGSWVHEYVAVAGLVGSYSAIAIDTGDVPYIVYYNLSTGDLMYAHLVSP